MVGRCPIQSFDQHIHLCLLTLAERGNQDTPIAARLQSRPARLGDLLGASDPTTLAAAGGSAYNFHSRPFQYSCPKPLRLDRLQTKAVADELSRLRHVCNAVEPAPPHDSDKAILQQAPSWEKTPLRIGPWLLYNRQCTVQQRRRRAAGLAFRDVESPVFTIPEKDGAFRLCTDY
jgi:hypothetical protein